MANLAPQLRQRFFTTNGAPLSGGKVYTYLAGTTTPAATYTDQSGVTPNANPVVLDANGEADIWIGPALLKFVLKNSADVTQWTVDNVSSSVVATLTTGNLLQNYSLSASVVSNALTIALKTAAGSNASVLDPIQIGFRNVTLATGSVSIVQVSAALSTFISSGSTAGHNSAIESPIYVGVMNNAGTVELCWSSTPWDENELITTTAEGGAGAADSATTIYSTTARTGVASRILGKLLSTQATAGAWVAAPSNVGSNSLRLHIVPTTQLFTSGSGTYTLPVAPRKPLYIVVEIKGGGGGGGGSSVTATSAGTTGTATTFSAGTGSAGGGIGATVSTTNGALGGANTLSTTATIILQKNFRGSPSGNGIGTSTFASGGLGGGYGGGPGATAAGTAGLANTGGGGSGGGINVAGVTAGGGGEGGTLIYTVTNMAATYSYAVGGGGAGGAAGTGTAGGAGGSGYVLVTEYYQ